MKKTRIISLLLLVVVCTVALCACQPDQEIAQENFEWVKVLETPMQAKKTFELELMNYYPIEILADSKYQVVVYGDAFRKEEGLNSVGQKKTSYIQCLIDSAPTQQGSWGSYHECDVALYFFDEQQNVDGYAIVKVHHVRLKAQRGGLLEPENETTTLTYYNYYFYYGQVIKSVKFSDGAIPFEQAQSVVESQLDLPQQSAN